MPLRLREDSLAWRAVDDRVVLLDLRSSQYLQINEAGSMLFQRLAEGADEADLVRALISAYGLDVDRAAGDVRSFLDMLRAHDLLQMQDESA